MWVSVAKCQVDWENEFVSGFLTKMFRKFPTQDTLHIDFLC